MGDDSTATAGTRVQILIRVLGPDERPPGLPADTARLPYEARVRGTLLAEARIGERCAIRTVAGRELEGVLEVVEPADTHTFGRPLAALLEMTRAIDGYGRELRCET